jgi:regulator of sirC expression with transglutaminase-like and TPR domain
MVPTSPLCCAPAAFRLLGRQLSSINSPDALLQGALAIAMHEQRDVKPAAIDRQIQGIADRVRGSQPQALFAHLHEVLFEEEHFTGSDENYYDPDNSYLPSVLRTHRGLPITLSLVYKLVADRLGLRTWGVGLPGHFVIGIDDGTESRRTTLVDPFHGGSVLTVDEARARVADQFGPEVEWTDELLRPVNHRHWLTRMLQNLLNLFGAQDQYANVAAMLEMEMLLWPEQGQLQRDLALVLARCGHPRPAGVWLDRYLRGNPDDPQSEELQQLRDVLR